MILVNRIVIKVTDDIYATNIISSPVFYTSYIYPFVVFKRRDYRNKEFVSGGYYKDMYEMEKAVLTRITDVKKVWDKIKDVVQNKIWEDDEDKLILDLENTGWVYNVDSFVGRIKYTKIMSSYKRFVNDLQKSLQVNQIDDIFLSSLKGEFYMYKYNTSLRINVEYFSGKFIISVILGNNMIIAVEINKNKEDINNFTNRVFNIINMEEKGKYTYLLEYKKSYKQNPINVNIERVDMFSYSNEKNGKEVEIATIGKEDSIKEILNAKKTKNVKVVSVIGKSIFIVKTAQILQSVSNDNLFNISKLLPFFSYKIPVEEINEVNVKNLLKNIYVLKKFLGEIS